MPVGDLICSMTWRKVLQASGVTVSNAFCSRTVDTSNMSLNERMLSLRAVDISEYLDCSQEARILQKADFCFCNNRKRNCLSPGGASVCKTVDENEDNRHV